MSENIMEISQIGLDAVEVINGEKKLEKSILDKIDYYKKPVAQTELMIISGIEKLVKAGL